MSNLRAPDIQNEPATIDLFYKVPVKFWGKIKEYLDFGSLTTRRWVYATVSFTILLGSTFLGIKFYNTTYQLMLSEDLLQENYRIYMEDTPRLSGGFPPTGIRTLMTGDQSDNNYLDQAMIYSDKAIDYESTSKSAKYMKARILLIKKEFKSAAKIFEQIEKTGEKSTPFLNDIGVIRFNQGNMEEAISYFRLAQKRDPEFKEVYYNLALALTRTGETEEALIYLEKYLKIENDEGWRNAAAQLNDSLTNKLQVKQ
jgi:tetratricopeptide (TPR) repeat protein